MSEKENRVEVVKGRDGYEHPNVERYHYLKLTLDDRLRSYSALT